MTKEKRQQISEHLKEYFREHPVTEAIKKKMSESQKKQIAECGHRAGEGHYEWKGEKVGYKSLHKWVASKLGKPMVCEHCKKTFCKGSQIHWANKSGQYLRDVTDWLRLCCKCHQKYEKTIELKRLCN
jgi:hypothetical protein